MATVGKRINWEEIKARIAEVERVIQGGESRADRDELLARRAKRYRRVEEEQAVDTVELVVFRRRGNAYAVSLEALEEIRLARTFTPLPGISPVIPGIINVRGHIVAMHDLASFSAERAELPQVMWAVIGRAGDTRIALVADEVDGVVRPTEEAIRPVPLSLEAREGCFRGVLDDGTIVLDIDGLARSEEFFLA